MTLLVLCESRPKFPLRGDVLPLKDQQLCRELPMSYWVRS